MIRIPLQVLVTVYATVGALLAGGIHAKAQEINKDVYVVQPYEPTISEATKYSFLPVSDQTEPRTPVLQYSITPMRLVQEFTPEPIKAAKTMATSFPKIYKSWLKLGLGNYATPLAEFNISNLRSKEYAYGAYLYHKSSQSKIILSDRSKVPASYATNEIKLYGRRFFPGTTLSGDMHLTHDAFHYYGYNTDLGAELLPLPDKDSTRQSVFQMGCDIALSTNKRTKDDIEFDISLMADYLADRHDNRETDFGGKISVSKEALDMLFGLDMSLDYMNLQGEKDTLRNTLFRFGPWISKKTDDWQFCAGFEATADAGSLTRYYFYPKLNLDITVIRNILIPFVGLSGNLQKNSYQQVLRENRFVAPGTALKNTSSNLIAYAGIKGQIQNIVQWRLDVSYTVFKNHHFFVIDTLSRLDNMFTAVYDDVDLLTYHAQIGVKQGRLDFALNGHVYDYSMLQQDKPWHCPAYKIDAETRYAFNNKLSATFQFSLLGSRWAPDYQAPDDKFKIKPLADINLKVLYQYSKTLSLFADLFNLADQSYLVWHQYPSQRFNFLFGFSYKL
jgi:hypothetical protein